MADSTYPRRDWKTDTQIAGRRSNVQRCYVGNRSPCMKPSDCTREPSETTTEVVISRRELLIGGARIAIAAVGLPVVTMLAAADQANAPTSPTTAKERP
jgi:hypothetical protein